MICGNCKRDISPLTLVNGRWACPKCKAILAHSLIVNKKGYELSNMSEIGFLKAIEEAGSNRTSSKKNYYKMYIENSISNALLAIKQSDPKGYLMYATLIDYGYIEPDLSLPERARMASPYYYSVCSTSIDGITILDQEIKDTYIVEYDKIRQKAANQFYRILCSLSDDDIINYGLNEYNFYMSFLNKKYNFESGNIDAHDINVMNIINDAINPELKSKRPIIGFFKVDYSNLKEFFNLDNINFKKWAYSIYKIEANDKIDDDEPSISIKNNGRVEQEVNNRQSIKGIDEFGLLLVNMSFKSNEKRVTKFIKWLSDTNNHNVYDKAISRFYNKNMSTKSTMGYRKPYFLLYEDDIIFKDQIDELLDLLIGGENGI